MHLTAIVWLVVLAVVWLIISTHDNRPHEDGRWLTASQRDWLVMVIAGTFGLLVFGYIAVTLLGSLLGL